MHQTFQSIKLNQGLELILSLLQKTLISGQHSSFFEMDPESCKSLHPTVHIYFNVVVTDAYLFSCSDPSLKWGMLTEYNSPSQQT